MIYLVLPRGNNFGWGICGKYLVKELSRFTDVRYITDPFDIDDIGDEIDFHFLKSKTNSDFNLKKNIDGNFESVHHPILQAIANHTLRPWGLNLRGSFKAGYTFFEENILSPESVSMGRENFDVVVAGSSWCEDTLRNHGLDQVTTILQGIDPLLFNPHCNTKDFFKDKFVVFSGGKFEFRKGQDLVIKAYKAFQDRYPDVILVNSWFNQWHESMATMSASPHIHFHMGSGDYVRKINRLLESNGIDLDRVITMRPQLNSAMARVYKNTDVGLFPNRCEGGTNLVLMEYMACGKPAIVSYSSGHKDVVNHTNSILIKDMKQITINSNNKAVAIWDDPDPAEIVDHLEWAYHHRDELTVMGMHAASDLKEHTWESAAKNFMEILGSGAVHPEGRRSIIKSERDAIPAVNAKKAEESNSQTIDTGYEENEKDATSLDQVPIDPQILPDRYSDAILEKNMTALNSVNANLLRRVCLPVDGSHIQFSGKGKCFYQRHGNLIPFLMEEKDLSQFFEGTVFSENIILFGIGLGEQLDYLIRRSNGSTITVWDRDPWLIRLALMQKDFSEYILSGRLNFSMGMDLLDLNASGNDTSILCHPYLGNIYRSEYDLLLDDARENRAIVCSGGLFVDDIKKALRDLNYSLYTLDIKSLALEEMEEVIMRFDPRFIFSINYTNGLAEFCNQHDVPLICWEVDPAADRLRPCQSSTNRTYIYTHRSANIEEYSAAGFEQVEQLHFASDTEKRFCPKLSKQDMDNYGANLSFVGSSMKGQADFFREAFLSLYSTFKTGQSDAVEEGSRLLNQVLSQQCNDFTEYKIPDLLNHYFSDFIDHLSHHPDAYDPYKLVGEIAASQKRIHYLAEVGHMGLRIWGDEGWCALESNGIKYMGSAGHHHEINKIYGASLINIDINRIYQDDIVTMRVFDILACGGFLLTEYSVDLENVFEIDKEIVTYHTLDELVDKSSYYLEHRDEAMEIANLGREAVIRRHTIQKRVEHMLTQSNNIYEGQSPALIN